MDGDRGGFSLDGCKGPYSNEGNLELKGEIFEGSIAVRAMPVMAACVALPDVPTCVWGGVTGGGWDPTCTTLLGITCGSHHP